jgi:hypothetical protein
MTNDWAGPQWVLMTIFAVATLANIGGFILQKKPMAERVGWLGAQISGRFTVVAILIWGGFL